MQIVNADDKVVLDLLDETLDGVRSALSKLNVRLTRSFAGEYYLESEARAVELSSAEVAALTRLFQE